MVPMSPDPDYQYHVETYRGFVRWVAFAIATGALAMAALAVLLL
jgi:hypothetical protein